MILLLCLLLPLINARGSDTSKKSLVLLKSLSNCEDTNELPITLDNVVISQDDVNKLVVYGQARIRRDIQPPLSLVITLHKCPSKENMDLCEYFFSFKVKDFCTEIGQPGTIWNMYWEQTNLPKSCPFLKGNYSLDGLRITTTSPMIVSLGLGVGFWKTRAAGRSSAGNWFCADTQYEIIPEKKRKRRPINNQAS